MAGWWGRLLEEMRTELALAGKLKQKRKWRAGIQGKKSHSENLRKHLIDEMLQEVPGPHRLGKC